MHHPILSWLSKVTAVSALAATLAVSIPGWAEAFGFVEKSGMVGLIRGQTARLNAVNTGTPNESSCPVELSFLDSMGNTVALGPHIIPPGQADFLDLDAASLGGPDTRVQIRATVAIGGPEVQQREVRACTNNLRLTLEVFDTVRVRRQSSSATPTTKELLRATTGSAQARPPQPAQRGCLQHPRACSAAP
ncbi:MAG: hypothetical protein ACRERD_15695, partial [Candidatus Binatia bacterium]